MSDKDEVIAANIRVHEALLLSGEYKQSPHRSKEARERIAQVLLSIGDCAQVNTAAPDHLDVGCGDGLMFECTPSYWRSTGVDAAPKMLEQCKIDHPNVLLLKGTAENLPVEASSQDIVTCYSFLDHLVSRAEFYAEAFRVCKPGGYIFFGLSPNRMFAEAISNGPTDVENAFYNSEQLRIEKLKVVSNGQHYENEYGLLESDLVMAEPGKTFKGGMLPSEEIQALKDVGFIDVRVEYNWVMCEHQVDTQFVDVVKRGLPLTASCFKYFDLIAKKGSE